MGDGAVVRRVDPTEDLSEPLAEILVDCVEGGASVGFMLPLSRERAQVFWRRARQRRARRADLVRRRGGGPGLGTVQLVLEQPENQPHRGEIVKCRCTGGPATAAWARR